MHKQQPRVIYHGEMLENVDAVIPRIGASVTFFGTAVVRQFELAGIFTVNESQSITRSRDKLRSMQILSREGVGIPRTVFAKFPKNQEVDQIIDLVGGTPVVIKVLEGTQGLGVVLAETRQSAKSMIEAFSGLQTNILVQEFVKEARGADIRAFIVGGEVVGAMRRQGKAGEFRSNLHCGGTAQVIDLTPEERATAIKAAEAMKLGMAGVDMLQSERGPMILEVNSSPGLQGIEGATRVDIAGRIIEYIERNVGGSRRDED
jgi:ribosomal protein S6--L-glutamate ligase